MLLHSGSQVDFETRWYADWSRALVSKSALWPYFARDSQHKWTSKPVNVFIKKNKNKSTTIFNGLYSYVQNIASKEHFGVISIVDLQCDYCSSWLWANQQLVNKGGTMWERKCGLILSLTWFLITFTGFNSRERESLGEFHLRRQRNGGFIWRNIPQHQLPGSHGNFMIKESRG